MKRKTLCWLLAPAMALATSSVLGQAVPACSDVPNQVTVRVHVDVKHDAMSKLYTYTYTVQNDSSSKQEVDRFAVETMVQVSSLEAPPGWINTRFRGRPVVGWYAVDVADPDLVPNDASLPPSIAQIKPGSSRSGFVLQSGKPPGPARYFVTGFVPLMPSSGSADIDPELEAERMMEACPHLQEHVLDQALVGSTLAPVDAIPIVIDVKPGSDTNPVNPRQRGVVPVAVLGAAGFDVAALDAGSMRLGPKQAAPRKSEDHREDVNRDGFMDLVLHFPVPEVGVECGDTMLFLTGRLREGGTVVGTDGIVTPACE